MSSIHHPGLSSVWVEDVSADALVFVVVSLLVLGANAWLIRQSLHRPR